MHEHEIHLLHRIERDRGVRPRALRGSGDIVLPRRIGIHLLPQRGDEGRVERRAVVLVVDVEAIDDGVTEGSQAAVVPALTAAAK